ncbi:hypothetical protein, partial [Intrasporangium sp.]|uniref:hypothetical protein n=1 Tax=Intrasporangium sp. TaxID=1925024 RepID=UPI00293C08D3
TSRAVDERGCGRAGLRTRAAVANRPTQDAAADPAADDCPPPEPDEDEPDPDVPAPDPEPEPDVPDPEPDPEPESEPDPDPLDDEPDSDELPDAAPSPFAVAPFDPPLERESVL